jgi:hypothetical protein
MKTAMGRKVIAALVGIKTGRSRVKRTGLSSKGAKSYEDFADSVVELYQLLDKLSIEQIENLN